MTFKILIIEDNEDYRFFFKRAISNSGVPAEVVESCDGLSGLEKMKNTRYDCIFLDYHLPGMNGLDILKETRSRGIDTPIIMLTGQKNEKTIVQLLHEGATDYLSKDSLNPESLRLSIENSQRLYLIKKEKFLAEQALRLSETKLAEAQKIAQVGNWEYDFISKNIFFSEEAYSILQCSSISGTPTFKKFSRKIHSDDFYIFKKCMEDLKNDSYYDITFRIYTSDNVIKYLNAKGHLIVKEDRIVEKIVGTVQDVTILKNALQETKKVTAKKRATSIVFTVAIIIFLISEAVLDPFIDSFATGLLIALSFKGSIALMLKPVEGLLGKIMMSRII
ncbi:MAG TPA: response regulator [Cytophagaceae bacterium]|jgi:DNA-binding response OmpR family regulator|nr:response regulator [Cytophagaceae bacterium]